MLHLLGCLLEDGCDGLVQPVEEGSEHYLPRLTRSRRQVVRYRLVAVGDVGRGEPLVVRQLHSEGLSGVVMGKGHLEINRLVWEIL